MCSSSENFKNRFLRASDNGISYDCKFIVGSEKVVVEGHKIFFSVASKVFQAMFYGELKEDNAVKIEDLDANGFEGMKHFIYTGEVNFTSAIHALTTYVAARKYLIPELTKECSKYIEEKIKPLEVLEFYEYCERNNIPEFDELCFRIIEEKTDEVVNSEYFPTVKIETIQLILKSRSLKLKSEIEVFNLFEKWALAEADRKQISEGELANSFKNLKKCIRFLTISSEEFTSRIEQSLLLTEVEKRAIECNLLELDSKPMPENLSMIQQQRRFLSTLSTLEKYESTVKFVVSLGLKDAVCESCSEKTYKKLILKIIKVNNKYLSCVLIPSRYSGMCKIFKVQTKVSVFALNECDDLIFRNEYEILSRPHDDQCEVSAADIPIVKLGDKFLPRAGNKAVTIEVQFNCIEIK